MWENVHRGGTQSCKSVHSFTLYCTSSRSWVLRSTFILFHFNHHLATNCCRWGVKSARKTFFYLKEEILRISRASKCKSCVNLNKIASLWKLQEIKSKIARNCFINRMKIFSTEAKIEKTKIDVLKMSIKKPFYLLHLPRSLIAIASTKRQQKKIKMKKACCKEIIIKGNVINYTINQTKEKRKK